MEIIKGNEIDRNVLLTCANKNNLMPETCRIIFKTSREPDFFHIASPYNIKDYSVSDISTSFQLIVYNILNT